MILGKRIVLGLLLVFCFATPSYAVSVRPSFFDIATAKGEQVTKTITITNDSTAPLQFLLDASDVRFTKAGTPQFLGSSKIPADSLLWWIRFDKGPFTLPSGQSQTIEVEIAVPNDADPGGHYGALLVQPITTHTGKEPANIGLESKIASLFFADVAGTAYRHFAITQFSSDKSLYTASPVTFNLLLQNDGVTHLKPHGTITITNDLSHEVVGKIVVNEDGRYLMPKASVPSAATWKAPAGSFGKYTATLSLSSAHAPSQTAAVVFWIVPVTLLAGIGGGGVLVLLLLGIYTWYIIRKHATR